MYQVMLTRQAQKDRARILATGLGRQVRALIEVLKRNPYQSPPPCEKLLGDLAGFYSRRINRQHRLVYSVHEVERVVKIERMWTHYEG